MRILFDQNISHRLIKRISDIIPEGKQVRELELENFTDKEIGEFARNQNYTILTFDSDFYDFSINNFLFFLLGGISRFPFQLLAR